MQTILLIEDDAAICDVIRLYFTDEGTPLRILRTGSEALAAAAAGLEGIGLVLLDVMLPGADGFTICRSIRRHSDVPIIFLTARGREEDMLRGYALGCDDYIVKPFSLAALHAKCMAMLRRASGQTADPLLTCGQITLNTRTLQCFAAGAEVELTPKAYAILHYLMRHAGWVIDRDTLLNAVWGSDYFGSDRVVDNHIRLLRKALGKTVGRQVKTVIGRGYRLTDSVDTKE